MTYKRNVLAEKCSAVCHNHALVCNISDKAPIFLVQLALLTSHLRTFYLLMIRRYSSSSVKCCKGTFRRIPPGTPHMYCTDISTWSVMGKYDTLCALMVNWRNVMWIQNKYKKPTESNYFCMLIHLSLIHIWRCRRLLTCRSRWSPYH